MQKLGSARRTSSQGRYTRVVGTEDVYRKGEQVQRKRTFTTGSITA